MPSTVPRLILACATAAAIIAASNAAPVLSLSLNSSPDIAWTVCNGNGSIRAVAATVPGGIHGDLQAAGLIGDPNYGLNEQLQRWIASDNFTYSTSFSIPSSSPLLSKANVDLLFEGLDTAAAVYLNSQQILTAANMHRTWRVPVKSTLLSSGANNLTVAFTGPVPYSLSQAAACAPSGAPYCPDAWPGPAPAPLLINGYIRKEQESFSWDFAPATGTSGIWRPVSLVAYDGAVIAGVSVNTWPLPASTEAAATSAGAGAGAAGGPTGTWVMNVSVRLYSSGPAPGAAQATLSCTVAGVAASVPVTVAAGPGYTVATLSLRVPNPALWWPNGYGAQVLYTAALVLTAASGETAAQNVSVGFRTVQLDQSPLPAGNLFRFVVNGVPILARGSNWVPADSLQYRVTPGALKWLFSTFAAAHWNTLRIWGGGVYADDSILSLADQYGLLLYHDAMFGDQFYQVSNAFLTDVAAEIADNAWRMASHPSLAVISGSNEMASGYADGHQLFADSAYYSDLYFATVLANFSAVGVQLAPASGLSPPQYRPAVSSTPSSGNETAAQPFHLGESTTHRGDMHFYAQDNDCWNVSLYPAGRFITEHGWLSLPSLLTMAPTLSGAADYEFNGTVMVSRDHHPPGQEEMTFQVMLNWLWPSTSSNSSGGRDGTARYRRLAGDAARIAAEHRAAHPPTAASVPAGHIPEDALLQAAVLGDAATVFRDILWQTQVTAAQCYSIAGEGWRRASNTLNNTAPGSGGTYGILYWQANDVWPAPSWSMVEGGAGSSSGSGRAKATYYASARTFAPLLVSGYLTDNTPQAQLVVYLSNSALGNDLANLTLSITSWSYSGGQTGTTAAAIPAAASSSNSSALIYTTPLQQLLQAVSCPAASQCLLGLAVYSLSGVRLASNWVYLTPLNAMSVPLADPQLAVNSVTGPVGATADGYDVFNVTLAAAQLPAIAVWAETALPGRWSDNGFCMLWAQGGTQATMQLQWVSAGTPGAVTPGQLASSLVLHSLYDVAPYGTAP